MKNTKVIYVTMFILLSLIILVLIAIKYSNIQEAKCIGKNSKLYIQTGSKLGEEQIKIIGENIRYYEIINCFSERDKCENINLSKTPAWIIKNEKSYKVYNLNKLKELTNC